MDIIVENVSKVIHHKTVLDSISLKLSSGVIYGLVGANGGGKTMIIRLVCGLIKPTTGKVYLNNRVLGKEIDFPESVGLLLENPTFIDEYTGKKNLQLLAQIRGRAEERDIVSSLQRVGLDENDIRKYGKYSLGMKQRLGIAAAIMETPDVILLDEPTNALDTEGVKMLCSLVNIEKERGAIVVIASHNQEFIQSVADKIFLVREGSITEIHIDNTVSEGQ